MSRRSKRGRRRWRINRSKAHALEEACSDLVFAEAEIVGRRNERLRAVNAYQDDFAYHLQRSTARLVEGHRLVVKVPGIEHGRDAFEPVALADDRIDYVHFDTGILPEIRQCAR